MIFNSLKKGKLEIQSVGNADEIVFFDKLQIYNVNSKYPIEGKVMNTNRGSSNTLIRCLTTDTKGDLEEI